MSTYHEKVAKRMSESMSVGPYATYDEILAALLAKFPDEDVLRKWVEHSASLIGAPQGWTLVDE